MCVRVLGANLWYGWWCASVIRIWAHFPAMTTTINDKSSINESSKLVIVSSSSVSTPGILSGQPMIFCITCLTPLWMVCPTLLMAFLSLILSYHKPLVSFCLLITSLNGLVEWQVRVWQCSTASFLLALILLLLILKAAANPDNVMPLRLTSSLHKPTNAYNPYWCKVISSSQQPLY